MGPSKATDVCEKPRFFMGLDLSTQGLKAVVLDDNSEIAHEASVHFDAEMPEFKTTGGVIKHEDKLTVTAPTLMWVKAFDILFDKLKRMKLDFSNIVALSGDAQQHGSVYWKKGAEEVLANLDPEVYLHEQLKDCFQIPDSPTWMDSSTFRQRALLENAAGGPLELAKITGSRGYERYTGSQIAKLSSLNSVLFKGIERISLVSSFAASLFLGKYAPIDFSDGSGMNLLDINSAEWSDKLLKVCANDLKEKLGDPVCTKTVLGNISPYFVQRYGFEPECKVVVFTGDNPASVAGLKLKEGDIAISLGTSDTMFLWLRKPKPSLVAQVMFNPIDCKEYIGLVCYKNGSLTREKVRDRCAEGSWELFNTLLESTPRGNSGNIGLYFDSMEIIPRAIGTFRFNKDNEQVEKFSKEIEIRALIEGQCLAKRVHAEELGYHSCRYACIIATGGASVNKNILQVLADVFNAEVYVYPFGPDSACLGAAYLAKHAVFPDTDGGKHSKSASALEFKCIAKPHKDAVEIYEPMLARTRVILDRVTKMCEGDFEN